MSIMAGLLNGKLWQSTIKTPSHPAPKQVKQPAYFRITTSYGNVRCYPVDATAKLLCELSGFKTLLPAHLGIIEELGFECLNEVNDATIVPSMLY
jgi:hypothetical protein